MVNFFNQHGETIAGWLRQIGLDWPAPDWHTLFYLNVPIGIGALILTWWALRGVEHPVGRGRFDFVGAILASLALLGLNIGGGVRYLGSSWGDPANTFKVPESLR